MKKTLILLCTAAILLAAPAWAGETDMETESQSGQRTFTLEGPGYDTAEDAVLGFLEGLNNGNATEMLQTFAIESFVDHANPEDYLRRMQSFSMNITNAVPLTNEYAKTIILGARYGELARALQYQYVEFAAHTDGMMRPFEDEAGLQEFLSEFENSPVNQWQGNVEFVEWVDPSCITGTFFTAMGLANLAKIMACAGADDYAELAAHIRLNGVDAIQLMECVKYGPRWYNYSFSGLLANILGLNAYAGGLIYPGGDWDIEAILQAEPDLDDELEEIRQSWEESGMQGTRWKLVSADLPGVYARAAESRDDAINDTGVSIYADLKFTHLGGATLSYCLSPEAAGSLEMEEGAGTGTLMKTVAVWWETEGKIRFDAGSGISRTAISLNGMECTRAEDTMIVQAPEWGAAFVFQYVEE